MVEPSQLLILTQNIKKCGDIVNTILNHVFHDNIDNRYLEEEYYYDYKGKLSYPNYVVTEIDQTLRKNKIVAVNISNSSVVIGDETYDHVFLLYFYEHNIYRIESYFGEYCTRMIMNKDYKQELYNILSLNPGKQRLSY